MNSAATPVRTADFYYERKLVTQEYPAPHIENLIRVHPCLFSQIFHERFVNNIYFDAIGMDSYHDAVEGSPSRSKLRIRWYGTLFGHITHPNLELKSKQGLLVSKTVVRLPAFTFEPGFSPGTLTSVFREAEIPDGMRRMALDLQAVLLNRYRRKYFLSADKKYRITIDSDLEYYCVRGSPNTFLNRIIQRSVTVLELKYDRRFDDGAESVMSFFPFRYSRNSKYASGVEAVVYP